MRSNFSKQALVKVATKASRKAVQKTRDSGGAITFQSGRSIVKQHADGHKEILGVLDKAYIKPSKKRYSVLELVSS